MNKKYDIKLKKFSKRLDQLIKNSDVSPNQLADEIGLSVSTIYRYISGEVTPKIPTLEIISDFFDVNPAWLSGYDVDKNKPKKEPETIAAHLDIEENLTEEEMEELQKYIDYILSRRDKK